MNSRCFYTGKSAAGSTAKSVKIPGAAAAEEAYVQRSSRRGTKRKKYTDEPVIDLDSEGNQGDDYEVFLLHSVLDFIFVLEYS